MISDRWGRKVMLGSAPSCLLSDMLSCQIADRGPAMQPVILIGNLTSFASVVAFGFSNSFMQASAARFAGGFFNGITGYAHSDQNSVHILLLGQPRVYWTFFSSCPFFEWHLAGCIIL